MSHPFRLASRTLALGAALVAMLAPTSADASTTAQYACSWPLVGTAPIAVELTAEGGELSVRASVAEPRIARGFSLTGAVSLAGEILGDATFQQAGQPDRAGDLFVPLDTTTLPADAGFELSASGASSAVVGATTADGLVVDRFALRLIATRPDGQPVLMGLAQTAPQSDEDFATFDVSCTLDSAAQPPAIFGPIQIAEFVPPARTPVPFPPPPPVPPNTPGAWVCDVPGFGQLTANLDSNVPETARAHLPIGAVGIRAIFDANPAIEAAYPPSTLFFGEVRSSLTLTAEDGEQTVFSMPGDTSFRGPYGPGARFNFDAPRYAVTFDEAGTVALTVESLRITLPAREVGSTTIPAVTGDCVSLAPAQPLSTFKVLADPDAATTPPATTTPATTTPATTPPVTTPPATEPPATPDAAHYDVTGRLALKGRIKGTAALRGSAIVREDRGGSVIGGTLTLPVVTTRLAAWGFLPLVAKIGLEQPAEEQLGGRMSRLQTALRLRLTSLKLFGLQLASGPACRGRNAPPTVFSGTASTTTGLSYAGSLPLDGLTACGAFTSFASSLFSAGAATVTLTLAPHGS